MKKLFFAFVAVTAIALTACDSKPAEAVEEAATETTTAVEEAAEAVAETVDSVAVAVDSLAN